MDMSDVQLHSTEEIKEKVILVGIDTNKNECDINACLDELGQLVETAGGEEAGRLIQRRERINPGFYIGTGKLNELKALINEASATGVVCDDELSPAQLKNMEEVLECKVMDRTMVILDIFAARAMSREGKIQVELAQLKYRLTRLTGLGASLSRLGGGIGTRGPGEKKLEVDRRYIKDRIGELKNNLEEIRTHRSLLRAQRKKKGTPVVSLVGYTNAGKSTILNNITKAGVLEEDKLFATLDTTTRMAELPNGSQILLTDTVGFIQKLSHHLVEAFKATLEELQYADILVHVVDASEPLIAEHMQVVYDTLNGLGCEGKPVITVFNKMDKVQNAVLPDDKICRKSINICAKNDGDLKKLLETIETVLKSFRHCEKILIPYTKGNLLNILYGNCEIISEEHTEEGTVIEAYINDEIHERLKNFIK
jgi:GTP-binding protein HflX